MARIVLIVVFELLSISLAVAAGLPDTIVRVKPSIVAIATFDSLRAPNTVIRGTGFVVGDGRTVITNAHVVDSSNFATTREGIVVVTGVGDAAKVLRAEVVQVSTEYDIAILKTSVQLPALALATDRVVREGEEFAFTGFPIGSVLGLYPVTHRGIVSSVTPIAIPSPSASKLSAARIARLRSGFSVLQLDATAYPGNSGSPVFDVDDGHVVGVINKVLIKSTKEDILAKPSGITYAIPIRFVAQMLGAHDLGGGKP